MGRKFRFYYHILKHAWNAYLRMVEVNYRSDFSCPKCRNNPDLIILDGIAMGTTKAIPEIYLEVHETQRYSMVPFTERSYTVEPPETGCNGRKVFSSLPVSDGLVDHWH